MSYSLHLGDCRDVLATIADNSIDSIVTDPPYELGFMGKAWDASGIAYDVTVWQQCYRVLKPGGHLIAFGGSRTYHRMAVAIEDAGFEIRDQIQWIYGSGFPKSLDVSKALDNKDYHRPGSKNNERGRDKTTGIYQYKYNEHTHTTPATDLAKQWQGWGTALKPAHEPAVLARKPLCGTVADNVTTWGVGAINVDATRVGDEVMFNKPAASLGNQRTMSGGIANPNYESHTTSGRWPANVIFDEEAASLLGEPSRFFYIAKASKAEREAGLDAPTGQRANIHTTVKPIALMRYLVRMVTPKGGVVLDPFTGSGSTGCAAVLENCNFIGIDIMSEYIEIAEHRIAYYACTDLMK